MCGFGVLILLIIGLSGISIYSLANINETVSHIYENDLLGISYIKDAQVNLIAAHRAEKNMILAEDSAEEARYIENIRRYDDLFEEAVENFKTTIVLDEVMEKALELEKLWNELEPLQEKVIQLNQQQKYNEAFQLSGENRIVIDKMESLIDELVTLKEQQSLVAYNDSNAQYHTTSMAIGVFIVICGIVSILVVVIISRIISKPVTIVAEAAKKIANGDLTVESIKVKNKDEIGDLANSFNMMASELRNMIVKITETSQSVATYSEELSASSEETSASAEQVSKTILELSNGVSLQSQELESASSNLGQISATIQQTAANAEAVTNASLKASDAAKQGAIEAENAVQKIDRVKQISMETTSVVYGLGKQSEEIGQIVDVIKSIADQTNLLALNAAIEAARAGEQGRGFAVVAEEVRKLAEQSSASTQQIEGLINSIQSEANRAVNVIESGSQDIYEGVEAVNRAGDSFKAIVEGIEKMVVQIQEISTATEQIASESNEIVRSVDSIAAVSQQTAASAQEVSAASEEQTASMEEVSGSAQELAHLAEELLEIVSRFRY